MVYGIIGRIMGSFGRTTGSLGENDQEEGKKNEKNDANPLSKTENPPEDTRENEKNDTKPLSKVENEANNNSENYQKAFNLINQSKTFEKQLVSLLRMTNLHHDTEYRNTVYERLVIVHKFYTFLGWGEENNSCFQQDLEILKNEIQDKIGIAKQNTKQITFPTMENANHTSLSNTSPMAPPYSSILTSDTNANDPGNYLLPSRITFSSQLAEVTVTVLVKGINGKIPDYSDAFKRNLKPWYKYMIYIAPQDQRYDKTLVSKTQKSDTVSIVLHWMMQNQQAMLEPVISQKEGYFEVNNIHMIMIPAKGSNTNPNVYTWKENNMEKTLLLLNSIK